MVSTTAQLYADFRYREFTRVLLLSLALHIVVLVAVRPGSELPSPSTKPLSVILAPRAPSIPVHSVPERKSVVTTRRIESRDTSVIPRKSAARSAGADNGSVVAATEGFSIPAPPPSSPTIDLDAALATARRQAREAPPRPSLETPRLPITVESAIAQATQHDEPVETRGANGEHVVKTRNMRCVTPIYVPHFLEGKTMLTQCEALKG